MSFLTKLLGLMSGGGKLQLSDQLIFNKVIAFKGLTNGSGTSTIVQNVATALSHKKLRVCVIDTSFLFPVQHVLLKGSEGEKEKDYLTYDESLKTISTTTKNPRVDVFYIHDRTIVDMLGDKDDKTRFTKFLNALKSYYDFILLDISRDFTSITTTAGIKANKVILVADESLGSIYHLQKTMNTYGTLAVPFDKMANVVLNKKVTNIVTPTERTLVDAKLNLIGAIPLSMEIASKGVTGEIVYDMKTTSNSIKQFNHVIDSIIENIYSQEVSTVQTGVKNTPSRFQIKEDMVSGNFDELDNEIEIEHIEVSQKPIDNTTKMVTKSIEIPDEPIKIAEEKDEDDIFDF